MKNPIVAPKSVNKNISIKGQNYEMIPEVVNEALMSLMLAWERLGQPKSVFSESGNKLMIVIIATWRDLFPKESQDWLDQRAESKFNEKTIHEQVKSQSGRSLASIPLYIHKIMKEVFKEDKVTDREYYKKLVKKFPIFQMANKV